MGAGSGGRSTPRHDGRGSDRTVQARGGGAEAALRPGAIRQLRDLVRRVQPDCAIDLDTNSYSVPWRLIGETVQVVVCAGRVVVRHAGAVVADHALCQGRRERIVDRQHLIGVTGAAGPIRTPLPPKGTPDLLRPLAEYEAVVGGGW
jgi:Mu transposase-like protein